MQTLSWIVLALIHATPALALFQPGLLTRLYAVEPSNQLFLLMHHRAALFLAVVVVCLWAIFDPGARRVAVVAVCISMIAFLMLYAMAGSPNALRTIAIADLVGVPFLAYAAWCAFLGQKA
jgi:glucan phosphoethanolaminetransferase (alkaline phosphatase superfamily)